MWSMATLALGVFAHAGLNGSVTGAALIRRAHRRCMLFVAFGALASV